MTVSAVRSSVIVLMEYFRHFLIPGARRVNGSIREWKHLALLAALVAAAVLMPLSVSWSEKTQIVGGIIAALIDIAVFGQFYIAVVVAQLVGLRLAQALKRVE